MDSNHPRFNFICVHDLLSARGGQNQKSRNQEEEKKSRKNKELGGKEGGKSCGGGRRGVKEGGKMERAQVTQRKDGSVLRQKRSRAAYFRVLDLEL